MRYIVLALALCFALTPASAAGRIAKQKKVKHAKVKKVKRHAIAHARNN